MAHRIAGGSYPPPTPTEQSPRLPVNAILNRRFGDHAVTARLRALTGHPGRIVSVGRMLRLRRTSC
jgi:hypothetical protein